MHPPKGRLTGTQLEILDMLWDAAPGALKATEVWSTLNARRGVARTTVLTMLQRLERRGWVLRDPDPKVARYRAAVDREEAAGNLAAGIVDEFFDGSASRLVASLLGSRRIPRDELARLRDLLGQEEDRCQD